MFVPFVLLLLKFIDGLLQFIEIYCFFLDNLAIFNCHTYSLCDIKGANSLSLTFVDVWFVLSIYVWVDFVDVTGEQFI